MSARAHPLNAICPYYTMFPLDFPSTALRRAQPGQWVVDPFCGRGTSNLAARLKGLNTFGVDSNPVAVALAQAKLVSTTLEEVIQTADDLLGMPPDPSPSGEFWELAYHPDVLEKLCALRAGLRRADNPSAVFLRAVILGALHGPLTKASPSHLSNQSPRTFAPKPAYAARYWREREMKPPHVEMIDVIRTRATRYLRSPIPQVSGRIVHGDSRTSDVFAGMMDIDWFITSPPYYGMKTYTQDQWLRNWFLGGPSQVDYAHPATQMNHRSAELFSLHLRDVWRNLRSVASSQARLIVRFGGINDRKGDPAEVFRESIRDSGWRLATIRSAADANQGKRQVSQFATRSLPPRPEFDAYCSVA